METQCERPQDAIDTLKALDSVMGVTLFGNGLLVFAPDANVARPRIHTALVAAGVHIARIAPIKRSLEGVFMSLVEFDRSGACFHRS